MHSMKDDWGNMGPGNCPFDTSTAIQQDITNLITKHDQLVIDSFKACGYSTDWITANCHRVRCKTYPMSPSNITRYTYSLDGRDLFSLVDKLVLNFEKFEARIETFVEFHNQNKKED